MVVTGSIYTDSDCQILAFALNVIAHTKEKVAVILMGENPIHGYNLIQQERQKESFTFFLTAFGGDGFASPALAAP